MSIWSEYAVGAHKPGERFQDNRKQFSTVSHTSHVEPAIEIARKAEIRAGLVFDKSILNKKRILVAWMSPNHWEPGYRYGNIKFDIDFASLIKEKKFYWVESIKSYSPHAPRILITDQERDKDGLKPYDPESDDGPWLYDRSEEMHYYNGMCTLEFMFEGDVSLADVTKIDFVKHHPSYCSVSSKKPKDCEFTGRDGFYGGSRFISRCIANGIPLKSYASSFIFEDGVSPNFTYQQGVSSILMLLYAKNTKYTGSVVPADLLSEPLALAFLHAFSHGRTEHARLLASQFKDEDSAIETVATLLANAIGLANWKAIID